MRIEANAHDGDDPQAVAALLEDLAEDPPSFVALYVSATHDIPALQQKAVGSGTWALHGATSCLGVLTHQGMIGHGDNGIGYFALWDEDGSFGSALEDLSLGAAEAAARATQRALDRADRAGEAPAMVWVSVAPGQEEQVIAGIEQIVGSDVPIMGGSAADNTVSGDWSVFGQDGVLPNGVVVSVLFPSGELAATFQSGYAPTNQAATVTKVDGRRVQTLDGRPAAEVYQDATGLIFETPKDEAQASILAQSSFNPVGRELTNLGGIPYHLLMHAATHNADGSIDFFAEVEEGTQLQFMEGSAESLTARAPRVARQARNECEETGGQAQGALVVFCAGCMLSVRDHMEAVSTGLIDALDGMPFLCIFTFGEQGHAINGQNCHGNLMISCVSFSN